MIGHESRSDGVDLLRIIGLFVVRTFIFSVLWSIYILRWLRGRIRPVL